MKKLIVLILLLPLFGCASLYRVGMMDDTAPAPDGPPLDIVVKNVGQGECVLIRTPGGRTVIIDGGLNRAIGTRWAPGIWTTPSPATTTSTIWAACTPYWTA
jgi:beta-lactamase superfamily II metal-dependent hydrolase